MDSSLSDIESDSESESAMSQSSVDELESESAMSQSSVDERETFLPAFYRGKEPKLFLSSWAKRKLRQIFLGKVISKDERKDLTEKYYCDSPTYELFNAGKMGTSPLSLLKYGGTNASRDVGLVHGEVNFCLRILIFTYESQLTLLNHFEPEREVRGKLVKGGKYSDLTFPFKNQPFTFPVPRDVMDTVTDRQIRKFLAKFDSDGDNRLEMAKSALGYKLAFHMLAAEVSLLLDFSKKADSVIEEFKQDIAKFSEQSGDSARILGNASQNLKSLREKDYLQKVDSGFKEFVQNKKSNLNSDEREKEKMEMLNQNRFLEDAKQYSKLRRALALVTKEKPKKWKKPSASTPADFKDPKAGVSGKAKRVRKNKGRKAKKSDKKNKNEKEASD